MAKKVAILGAGNRGCAFAGHLALKGFEVSLYEDPKFEHNVEEVKERGGIDQSGKAECLCHTRALSRPSLDRGFYQYHTLFLYDGHMLSHTDCLSHNSYLVAFDNEIGASQIVV